eukprot:5965096-Amphidinium_carterae.1
MIDAEFYAAMSDLPSMAESPVQIDTCAWKSRLPREGNRDSFTDGMIGGGGTVMYDLPHSEIRGK